MTDSKKNYYTRLFSNRDEVSPMEETKLMAENEDLIPAMKERRPGRRIDVFLQLLSIFMFVLGALMLVSAVSYKQSDKSCAAQLSIWSPLLDAVEYEERDWESIFTTKHSDWTGVPTAELEQRWHKLVNGKYSLFLSVVPTVLIPQDRVPALNRSIEQGFVMGGPEGQEGYIAGIEVFHHLHCLNVLRQALWVEQYPEGLVPTLFKYNSPEVARKHADHCISTLHQALTCNADLTPYLLYDSTGKGAGVAREDFQATHKCKKFDPLVEWITANGVTVTAESLGVETNDTS